MEVGVKRTTIARVFAGLGALSGAMGLLTIFTENPLTTRLAAHGWANAATLFLLLALYVLADGMVSFEKSKH
jgi:O-antigen/teichoic acid export membrane protein